MQDAIRDVELTVNSTCAVARAPLGVAPSVGARPVERDCHASMRYGLQMLSLWLCQKGFRPNCEPSSMSVSVEQRGFLFDIKIWALKESNVAFVTSGAGYVYDPKKINAKVTKLNEVLPECDYVVSVIGSRNFTAPPAYIPIPRKMDEDPGVFAVRSTLNMLSILAAELAKQGKGQLQEELGATKEIDFEELAAALNHAENKQLGQAVPENSPHAP